MHCHGGAKLKNSCRTVQVLQSVFVSAKYLQCSIAIPLGQPRNPGKTPLSRRVGQPNSLCFFFLWFGRSRSKARSLHENKLLSRKLQHGHRWSHANWQIKITKNKKHNNQKARRRSPGQICVSPSQGRRSKQRKGRPAK